MSGTIPRKLSDHINSGPGTTNEKAFKSSIFIYAEAGVVFQGLVQSLERTFTDIDIHLCSKFTEAEAYDDDIRLVLIHAGFVVNFSECATQCRRRFPNASITMMIDDNVTGLDELDSLFDGKVIQGLLPFNLKLDIWLAVIWLLLNGGEYYPSAMGRSTDRTRDNVNERPPTYSHQNNDSVIRPIKTLTIREQQILELLSEGLQNKIIADRLTLSEHTVKVHVHNLIRKLRVHNRTQAAAVYRNTRDQETFQPPFRGYKAPISHYTTSPEMARVM
ncbi:response regulator transcription factor [Phyllobacterium sp. SB3]|uniref:response regulator transcription factor n=1 Tax=Phyllobacterium sp. SB3 TaxID=3156073 RepID=UPI0032AEB0A8